MAPIVRLFLNKKAIFLTFISFAMLGVFMLMFAPVQFNLEPSQSTTFRIENLNEYVADLEYVYLPQIIDASSTRALLSLIEYMKVQDEFLVDFESSFAEVMQNGTIQSVQIDTITGQPIMNNRTFSDLFSNLQQASADSLQASTDLTFLGISVYQIEPWTLVVQANMTVRIQSESADWITNFTIEPTIPVTRFEDPFISVNSHGALIQQINKTLILSTGWNETNVDEHIQFGTYVHFEDSQAPSFLMKFENSTSPSECCGIESLLDPNDVGDQMQSYADYLFYNNSFFNDCTNLFNITEWPAYDNLKLENQHILLYNLQDASLIGSC